MNQIIFLIMGNYGTQVNQKPHFAWVQNAVMIEVGALGFEPRASYTPCKRASRTAPRPDFRALL